MTFARASRLMELSPFIKLLLKCIIVVGLVPIHVRECEAFSMHSTSFSLRPVRCLWQQKSLARRQDLQMCICIDCARVTNCAAYHFVESKHEQPHMTENPTFSPREGSPTIHVNVRTIRNLEDRQREIERMWKEHQSETERATLIQSNNDESLHGSQQYDLSPAITYEYDVVKCADYIHDAGCWVRNMPKEIREANPHFVPS